MSVANLAVMKFGGVSLLLPQHKAGVIETINKILTESEIHGSVGTLQSGGVEWPVFALNSEFEIQSSVPHEYRYCIGFNQQDRGVFSIACEQVSTLSIENREEFKPVHACMQVPGCPFESLLLHENNILLVSDVEQMQQFLMPEASEV